MAGADGRASKLVEASGGPESDPLVFYCSTYSTSHGVSAAAGGDRRRAGRNSAGPCAPGARRQNVAGVHPTTGKPVIKPRRTGYSKNLVPYVEYSKELDENLFFSEDRHFVTKHSEDYRPPQQPTSRLPRYASVETVLDSGFTRKHANNRDKPVDSRPTNGPLTTTRAFADFTPMCQSKIHGGTVGDVHGNPLERWRAQIGEKTDTAYTSNATIVHRFGDHDEFRALREERARKLREVGQSPRERNVNHVDLDGYTRQNQLDEYIGESSGKLRQADTGSPSMPSGPVMSSITRLSYQKAPTVFRCLDKGTIPGKKQPSGALRNLPEFLDKYDVRDPARFVTITQESYWRPVTKSPLAPIEIVPPSGYTKGNNTFSPTDKVLRELPDVHPTVAAAQNLRDRGLYQNVVIV